MKQVGYKPSTSYLVFTQAWSLNGSLYDKMKMIDAGVFGPYEKLCIPGFENAFAY